MTQSAQNSTYDIVEIGQQKLGSKMKQPKRIPGRIAPSARKVLLGFLERAGSPEAVILLIKAAVSHGRERFDDRSGEKWLFGAYEPKNTRSFEHMLGNLASTRNRHQILYELDSMIVAIPQFTKLDEIIGKEMIWTGKEIVFQDYSI